MSHALTFLGARDLQLLKLIAFPFSPTSTTQVQKDERAFSLD
jgi:hypothetical protein